MTISAQVQKNIVMRVSLFLDYVNKNRDDDTHIHPAGIKLLHLCTFFQKTTNIYKHDSDDIKNQ